MKFFVADLRQKKYEPLGLELQTEPCTFKQEDGTLRNSTHDVIEIATIEELLTLMGNLPGNVSLCASQSEEDPSMPGIVIDDLVL